MKLRWLGHSAFELVENNGINILIDPFIRDNPSCPIHVSSLNPDIICVTHAHSDHLGDTVEIAKNSNSIVICNYELSRYLQSKGIQAIGINCGAKLSFGGVTIRMLDAKHSSSYDFEMEIGYAGEAGSYLIEFENDLKVFHAGDTGLFSDLKFVVGEVYKPDIALLPIGNVFTMDPYEAAKATNWINPKVVIPMHYNSFPSIKQDANQFKKLIEKEAPNCETLIPDPLQVIEF
ncbi:MAG: metal-dependent hydrolase [Methanosphaera sp.]|nr:metal-dependent hydrolase [Methanosphaera sp.]